MQRVKTFIYVTLLLLLSIKLCGCHTMEGAGKDIQQGGAAIERAAD